LDQRVWHRRVIASDRRGSVGNRTQRRPWRLQVHGDPSAHHCVRGWRVGVRTKIAKL